MSTRQDKSTTERHARILRELVKRPENKLCADCKRNDPRWASWNIGVFLCIRCSGIHRGMGTHVSRVKSIDLDTWTPDQMESIQKWGNRRANLYWEAHLKPGHSPPDHKLESFIRSKYDSRRWARDGLPPDDPSSLDFESPAVPSSPSQSQNRPPFPATQTVAPAGAKVGMQVSATFNSSQASRTLLSASADLLTQGSPVQQTPLQIPPAQSNSDDLFSLDFSAPVSGSRPANQTSQIKQSPVQKDVKQDILSLYNAGTGSGNMPVGSTGAARPTTMSTNWSISTETPPVDPWSGVPSAPWGGAQTAQPTFNDSAIWGASRPANGQSGQIRQEPTPVMNSGKKDDAFGDIWSRLR